MITAVVVNQESGAPLQYANVALLKNGSQTGGGTTTGPDGRFQLETMATGADEVLVSFIGYAPKRYAINQVPFAIALEPKAVELSGATVFGSIKKNKGLIIGIVLVLTVITAVIIHTRSSNG